MIRENNSELNKTIVYTYDSNGNILTKKEYNYTTIESLDNLSSINTIIYQYNNENWKDQLTNFNGNAITYDLSGNVILIMEIIIHGLMETNYQVLQMLIIVYHINIMKMELEHKRQ